MIKLITNYPPDLEHGQISTQATKLLPSFFSIQSHFILYPESVVPSSHLNMSHEMCVFKLQSRPEYQNRPSLKVSVFLTALGPFAAAFVQLQPELDFEF